MEWVKENQTCLGDGADLCAELLLDPVQGEAIVVGDQVDGNTEVTKPDAGKIEL